jgi:acyl-CoA reductase-like NAD-dependent aldehyde dehydrogenase
MLKIKNPATGEVFEEVESTCISDLNFMFENAQKAQKKWKTTSFQERKDILSSFKANLLSKKSECARLITIEMGKPYTQALHEIDETARRVQWFLDHFENFLESRVLGETKGIKEILSWDPHGVVVSISAWNFPYAIASSVFAPALLTGNSVLYKPSEICPLSGIKLREILLESGLPKDLFQTIVGDGSVAQTLLEFPVDGVFFTGSYETGKKIANTIKNRFIPTVFELGGKDPAYVCEDANLEKTIDSLIHGIFYNAGQVCSSVERLYLHEKIYERFLEFFYSRVASLKLGDPMLQDTYIGPLGREGNISFLNQQRENALKKGAYELLSGGASKDEPGFFYKPSVLLNTDHSMSIMKEESFGPIVGIMKVKSDLEAVTLMNDSDYGLTASVFTEDFDRGKIILAHIESGSVYVNSCTHLSPNLPWGGRKHSGLGSTLSLLGIEEFVKPKSWYLPPS